MTAVISKMISMQASLTVSENEIAQYVMNHAEDVVTSTITAMAKNTQTSEASINRFCKKLGYKGFNSFKVALAQENFYNSMKERDHSDDSSLILSVSRDYRQMLLNTSAMLEEDVLTGAVAALKQAACIYVFAYATTASAALELVFKLNMIGFHAKAVTDASSMRMYASCVQSRDLVVAIVPSILMRDIYQAIALCKERGVKILAITGYDSPKLSSMVDFKFITSDKITARNSLALSNTLTALYVVDVLYATLLDSDRALRQKKLNSDAMLGMNQMMDNYLLEY